MVGEVIETTTGKYVRCTSESGVISELEGVFMNFDNELPF